MPNISHPVTGAVMRITLYLSLPCSCFRLISYIKQSTVKCMYVHAEVVYENLCVHILHMNILGVRCIIINCS